jgi:O-antigen/teichoic acid export membrane protein
MWRPRHRRVGDVEHDFDLDLRVSERRRSAFWGILFGYSAVGMALMRNILFVPIYLHNIALPEYGAWLATGGALALLLINDFGLTGVVTQKVSAATGAGDLPLFASLSGSALCISGLLALILTAISFVCLPLLNSSFDSLPLQERHTVINCFVIAVAANALGIIGATASSIIRSLQRSILSGSITLAADTANIIATLIGIYSGAGLYAIAGAMLARSLLLAGAGLWVLRFLFKYRLKIQFEMRWQAARTLFADSSRFFITSIAMKMQSQANVFFVGMILGATSAAIYSLTVRAHETVLMLLGQINSALVPSVTHLLASGNHSRFRVVVQRILLAIATATALAMAITVTLNASFLKLWVGGQLFGGQILSVITGVGLFVAALGYVAYDALLAQGKFQLVSRAFALTSVLHVTLLVLLLRMGMWAAPIATLVTSAVWGLVFWRNLVASIELTRIELRGLLGQLTLVVLVTVGVAIAFGTLFPSAHSWLSLIIEAVVCTITLVAGYLVCSSTLRTLAREEIGMTMRLFGSTAGRLPR